MGFKCTGTTVTTIIEIYIENSPAIFSNPSFAFLFHQPTVQR